MIVLHENALPMQSSLDLAARLNSLIGSELIASTQYRIAAKTVVGADYDACSEEFEKHADEIFNESFIGFKCKDETHAHFIKEWLEKN